MAPTEGGLAVVADAGPIIHLDELDALDLFRDFSTVIVPDAVWLEVEHHRPSAVVKPPPNFQRVQVGPTTNLELVRLGTALALARGELEALQILDQRRGDVFLTDDAAARLAAVQLGHRVHGTIGVLLRAARRGLMPTSEVIALLRAIPKRSTLHIRKDLLDLALQELLEAGQVK